MPDRRRHRGPHPQDAELFGEAQLPSLGRAVADLSWLLSRDYALPSSLKLVGDRYQLKDRQRTAVSRCACSDEQLARRRRHQVSIAQVCGCEVWIDGYNLLTTLEAALAGGVLLVGRDGCLRDMASMHGSYRRVAETMPAIALIGNLLTLWRAGPCRWLLDRSVSNSGRLRGMLLEAAQTRLWDWSVDLAADPDPILASASVIVATADSEILNHADRWFSAAALAIAAELADAWIVDLSPPSG